MDTAPNLARGEEPEGCHTDSQKALLLPHMLCGARPIESPQEHRAKRQSDEPLPRASSGEQSLTKEAAMARACEKCCECRCRGRLSLSGLC